MEAKEIFTNNLNEITSILDDLGLYVADCNLEINSPRTYDSLESLRKDVINKQATISFNIDCFMGKKIWRSVEPEFNPDTYLSFLGINMNDLSMYMDQEDDEEED